MRLLEERIALIEQNHTRRTFLSRGLSQASHSSAGADLPIPERAQADVTSGNPTRPPAARQMDGQVLQSSAFPAIQQPDASHDLVDESSMAQQPSPTRTSQVNPSDSTSIHAMVGATVDEDIRAGSYGSSSAGTFMQSVRRMVEQKLGTQNSPFQPRALEHQKFPLLVPENGTNSTDFNYVLPPRKQADHLMALYWRYVHTLYPYLDRDQIQEDYATIWSGDGSVSDERLFMVLLNAMFALCCQIDDTVARETRGSVADIFYRRARDLLDPVEIGSLRSVQCFLLLGQYFQATHQPHACWIFVGLATRTAQSLGLQLPETSERFADSRTRESLRRAWHGCILMDRVLSMTYGRPCAIDSGAATVVPFPKVLEHEYFSADDVCNDPPSGERPSIINFYIHTLELYDILHDILFNFYSITVRPKQTILGAFDAFFGIATTTQGHPSVFELERRISRWETNLPYHLRLGERPKTIGVKPVLYRQAVVLHQR